MKSSGLPGVHIGTLDSPNEFNCPHGITLDKAGRLLVCDRDNDRIQVFDQEGNHLDTWIGFNSPCDAAVGPDGEIYVPELKHRFSILDSDGNLLARWGDKESHEPGQFMSPHGVAIDSHGDIYVCEVMKKRGSASAKVC